MQIDGAEWPLPLQCFSRVFGLGFRLEMFDSMFGWDYS